MKRAQATLEYAVVIIVVVAALLAMQIYLKRSVQGRLRSEADQIGELYSPGHTTSTFTVSRDSEIVTSITTVENPTAQKTDDDGKTFTYTQLDTTSVVTTKSDTESRKGSETVGGLSDETLF